jgi:hypothetical protein
MGQRANLLIVENGRYRLFYSHWCANTLPTDLFWGPDYAVKFIQMQQEGDQSDWLDEVWAEGAAVVDLDKKAFLLFGGEDIDCDVPLRRVYLECLARVWRPWTVEWAYEGIASIADYVAYPRANVLSSQECRTICSLVPFENDLPSTVASIQWPAKPLMFYPLGRSLDGYLLSGESLLKANGADRGVGQLLMNELDERQEAFPTGGFHIDVPSRTVEFWMARSRPSLLPQLAERWPGWSLHWHRDSYEFQVERANGLLRFPPRSPESLKKKLSEILLHDVAASGPETLLQMAEHDRAQGKTVEINPWALRDDRLEIPGDVRRKIVATAIAETPDGPKKRNIIFSMLAKLSRLSS